MHGDAYCANTYSRNIPYSPSRSLWLTIFQSKPLQISFAGPCAHAVKFQCLPETRNEMGVSSRKKKKHLCILYLPSQALATHLCSMMAAQTLWCSRVPCVKADQTLSPCCVVWQDTHYFEVRPVFPPQPGKRDRDEGNDSVSCLSMTRSQNVIAEYLKRQPRKILFGLLAQTLKTRYTPIDK